MSQPKFLLADYRNYLWRFYLIVVRDRRTRILGVDPEGSHKPSEPASQRARPAWRSPGPPRSPAWRPRRLNGADYDSFVDDVFNDDGSEAENDDEILDRSSTADAKSPLSDPPHPAKVQNDLGSRDCKDECKSPSKLPYAETCKTPPSRQQPFIDNNNKPLQKQATDGTMRSSKGRTRKRDCEESNTLYNKDRVVNRAPRELFKGKRTRLKKQSHK